MFYWTNIITTTSHLLRWEIKSKQQDYVAKTLTIVINKCQIIIVNNYINKYVGVSEAHLEEIILLSIRQWMRTYYSC